MSVRQVSLVLLALFLMMGLGGLEAGASHEVVNARDFGATPGTSESQTEALHAAMRYFYDRGHEGTVYIPAGTYAIDGALRFHAGVDLVGDGMGQTVLKKSGYRNNYVVGNPILYSGSTELNVTVSHLTIDADRANRVAQGLGQVGGINIDRDIRNLTLAEVEIRDTTNGAILRRTKAAVIRDSRFDRTSGHAITTGDENHPVGEFRDALITNNLITNSSGGSGINLSRATGTTVTHNRIINQQQQSDSYGGIRIPNGGAYNTVTDNVVENYPRGIFVLTGAHNNRIERNTVIDSRIHGILVQADHNTFRDNLIRQEDPALNPESVIRLAPGSHNVINDNEIWTHSAFDNPGIRLTGWSNGNEIRNNIIDTSGTLVSIEGGDGNTVEGNARPAGFDENASYRLINRHSGKALEVANADRTDGANVQQWSDNGCSCQQWSIIQTDDGYYQLINRHSSKALDVSGRSTEDGANVIQWTNHNAWNQQFRLERNSEGYYLIINRNSGKALDVSGRSTADGGNVIQWSNHNGHNQQWRIVRD